MSIDVSPEAEAKAQQIPDFSERLERFIDDQFALEQWRKQRGGPGAAEVVAEGLRDRETLVAAEKNRYEHFVQMRALTERLSNGR